MKTSVLLLGCLLATTSLAQSTSTGREVWAWKDANGVVHYSDQPSPGARKIVLAGTSAPSQSSAAASTASANSSRSTPPPGSVTYSRLAIVSPENGASFFGADAAVDIRIAMEPALAPDDRLVTYMDGLQLPGQNQSELRLTSLDRGVHSIIAIILDARGNEKIRSEAVQFNVQQPSVIDNARNKGPAVRP